MLFLIFLTLLMAINLYWVPKYGTEGKRWLAAAHWLAGFPAALGFVIGAMASSRENWSVTLFFLSGAATVLTSGYAFYWSWRQQALSRRTVIAGIGGLLGLYLIGTTLDHWWFYRDREHSGSVSASMVKGCQGMMPVRFPQDSPAAIYRCPAGIVLGQLSAQPFVPWPDYKEERSESLKGEILSLMADATKVEGGQHADTR